MWWARWTVAGIALGLAINAAWWLAVAHPFAGKRLDELVIPAGTAAAIATGSSFVFAPNDIVLRSGETLRVVNRDSVAHTVGSTAIPPGASASVEGGSDGELTCTIHPSGHLEITLGERPPLLAMVAVVVGMTVGAVTAGRVLQAPS